MNFEWNTEYDEDKEFEEWRHNRNKRVEHSNHYLPRYFKVIGLAITFSAVIFKIKAFFYPNAFTQKLNVPDRMVFGIIVAGLIVEAAAKARVETEGTNSQRDTVITILFALFMFLFLPYISIFWHTLWSD
jgi:hypothetical protein